MNSEIDKPDPHEKFKKKRDHMRWSNFVDQIDSINLSDTDKIRARRAINYLEKILGKHFIADIFQYGHPLYSYFLLNAANLARIQLIDFAESLEALESSENFSTLIDKIKKAKGFSEGSTILESAYKLRRAGFTVALDIKVTFTNNGKTEKKKPDIRIVNEETGEDIYFEVSELGKSQVSIESDVTYRTLHDFIHHEIWADPKMTDPAHPEHILPYVRILRSLSDQELKEVIAQIQKLISRVRKEEKFHELIFKDAIEVGISPYNDHSQAKDWATTREMENFVESPPFNPNELGRLVNNITREIRQLPTDKPGIVIIWNNANLLFHLHDAASIINAVAQEISRYPHVFGVALNYNCGWREKNSQYVEIGDHLLISNTGRDMITRFTVFINNQSFDLALTGNTRTKLKQSFISSYAGI